MCLVRLSETVAAHQRECGCGHHGMIEFLAFSSYHLKVWVAVAHFWWSNCGVMRGTNAPIRKMFRLWVAPPPSNNSFQFNSQPWNDVILLMVAMDNRDVLYDNVFQMTSIVLPQMVKRYACTGGKYLSMLGNKQERVLEEIVNCHTVVVVIWNVKLNTDVADFEKVSLSCREYYQGRTG